MVQAIHGNTRCDPFCIQCIHHDDKCIGYGMGHAWCYRGCVQDKQLFKLETLYFCRHTDSLHALSFKSLNIHPCYPAEQKLFPRIQISHDMKFPTMCDQQRLRSACAYTQSDQSLYFSMTVKLLANIIWRY